MNTIKLLLYLTTATIILIACGNKQVPVERKSDLIEITSMQFSTDAMQLGKVAVMTFENRIKCNGSIVPLPNGIATVNAPIPGMIKEIYCHNGKYVDKNLTLLEIGGHEIIDIQKEFSEASAHYKRLKNEYERIKSLYSEKVTTEKEFIIAESEFKAAIAKYNGLKMKIEAIGLSISKIENGEFVNSYPIKAPIRGYVTNLIANIGSYIDSHSELIEIIDPTMFQVKLLVFATDIMNIKKGQMVRFKSINSDRVQYAEISSIGVSIDKDSKTIECYASISDKTMANPLAYEFVESEIISKMDTVTALPSNAIIKSETGNSVLVLNKQEEGKYFFNKVDVKIGVQYEGFTEIIEPIIDNLIITNGVYNISL